MIFQKTDCMSSPNFELNGWLSRATLKKICHLYDWDIILMTNVLGALALLHKKIIFVMLVGPWVL